MRGLTALSPVIGADESFMARIAEDIIAQILDRNDIVETIAGYIPLHKAGRNFKALCPFHSEKTPSFIINAEKQIFYCFGCHVGGNVISFVMKQENMTFPEAARMLADRAGIRIPASGDDKSRNLRETIFQINDEACAFFHANLLKASSAGARSAQNYLKKRGVDLNTVKAFRLGYALAGWDFLLKYLRSKGYSLRMIENAGLILPRKNKEGFYDRFRDRIMFPIFDAQGRSAAFGGRAVASGPVKYINSPETPVYTKGRHLFGLHLIKEAVRKEDKVVISEGYMDMIMPYQSGFLPIVASLGTALTEDQITLLRRFTRNAVMLFDSDSAGESASVRSIDLLLEGCMHVRVATLAKGEDPDSFVRRNGILEFQRRIESAQTFFDFKLRSLSSRYDSKTVEGKAGIVQDMLPTINRIGNAIVRSGYMKRLAETLGVPEAAILNEMQKVSGPGSGRPLTPAKEAPSMMKKIRAVEKDVLKMMLREDSVIPHFRKEITLSDFRDESIRRIVSIIFEFTDKGKEVNARNLMNHFVDEEIVQFIAQLTADEEIFMGDKDKIRRDYVQRMIKDRLLWQKKELITSLKAAQEEGDEDKVKGLLQRINVLVKQK